jgi:phosphohistidine swiveling domain-containing protein
VGRRTEFDWAKILNRPSSMSFSVALCEANAGLDKLYGISVPTFWANSITWGVYYSKHELADLGKLISEKIERSLSFAKRDVSICRKTCDQLVGFAKKIPLKNLSKMSQLEIAELIKQFYLRYLDVLPFVTAPHAIERYFEGHIKEMVENEGVVAILLSPIYMEDEERKSALKVAAYVNKHGHDDRYRQLLNEHYTNFCWQPLWSLHSEPLTVEYFDEEIKNILVKVKKPELEYTKNQKEGRIREKALKNALRKIKASRVLVDQVMLLQEYIFLRTYRKNAISQSNYYSLPLLHEIASRLNINFEEVKLASFQELIDCLTGKMTTAMLKVVVAKRKGGWAVLMWKGKINIVTGVEKIIETMERYRIVGPASAMGRVVKGNTACRGRVTGRVKVIRKLSELGKIEDGDVIVAKMTTPDYVIAMHKAAAIVTDEGGITCHAAIVSREFNIPCIVGTRSATQVLSDGDIVEVDADNGVVRVVEDVEIDENIKIIPGKTAFKGKVSGKVRIVLDANDFPKVEEGDILVTSQTTPEYLSSLYKVRGFIVDEDSLTSHAMLYAKALKLPSLIGTNFARNVLQDGELVELDATSGFVKRLQ